MAVTSREQEMLDLAAMGLSHREIAQRMGIQPGSVSRTLTLLNGGMGDNRAHLSMMARGSRTLLEAIQSARAM
jgi:FixJ family two-component response regulator